MTPEPTSFLRCIVHDDPSLGGDERVHNFAALLEVHQAILPG